MRGDKVQPGERIVTDIVALESTVESKNAAIDLDGDAYERILKATSAIKAGIPKKAIRLSP
jgi:hypothetical protein